MSFKHLVKHIEIVPFNHGKKFGVIQVLSSGTRSLKKIHSSYDSAYNHAETLRNRFGGEILGAEKPPYNVVGRKVFSGDRPGEVISQDGNMVLVRFGDGSERWLGREIVVVGK